jgi:hypothetical protein
VVGALAANAASGSALLVTQVVDPSFRKFVQDLAKIGSDKSFFIQKKYKQLMEPIDENVGAKEEDRSEENVDFEDSDAEDGISNQISEGEEHGMGVLALEAPSLEDEHTVVVIPVMEVDANTTTEKNVQCGMPSINSFRLAYQPILLLGWKIEQDNSLLLDISQVLT